MHLNPQPAAPDREVDYPKGAHFRNQGPGQNEDPRLPGPETSDPGREMLRLFLRLIRPLFLLGAVLLYALGAGIARYLGNDLNWQVYWLGQAWVTVLQLGVQFLNEYYHPPATLDLLKRERLGAPRPPGQLPRRSALQAGLACLAILATLTVLLIGTGRLSPAALLIMVLGFLGTFFYVVPPLYLESSGYGELTISILVAYLVPAFAFILQTGELHRLVAMSTLWLTALFMAMLLALELPNYLADLKAGRRTLMVRIGWQRGMLVHNVLILSAFLVLGVAAMFGMPRFAALPAFLALPIGLLQIWLVRGIAGGSKPNWRALTLTAVVLFASSAYLLTYSYWTH